MKTTINCFLPFSQLEETVQTVKELRASTLVEQDLFIGIANYQCLYSRMRTHLCRENAVYTSDAGYCRTF